MNIPKVTKEIYDIVDSNRSINQPPDPALLYKSMTHNWCSYCCFKSDEFVFISPLMNVQFKANPLLQKPKISFFNCLQEYE